MTNSLVAAMALALSIVSLGSAGPADKPLVRGPMAASPVVPPPFKTLRFSGIPNQNTSDLAAKYKPLADYLTKKLGVTVEYVPSADYNASVEAFKNGDIQMAWFGGFTGVQAREAVPGASVIACGSRDTRFKTYFVANKSLGLKRKNEFPMELKGKKFTFGSAQSTSGRLMPEYFIRKYTKSSPKDFFGAEPSFSGAHDKTMKLVESGAFDAGAVDYTVYDKLVKDPDPAKRVDSTVVQIIWVSPEFADYNFTVHPSVDSVFGKGFTKKLQSTLTSIAGADLKLLAAMDRDQDGLIVCSNSLYDDLRQVARDIGLIR